MEANTVFNEKMILLLRSGELEQIGGRRNIVDVGDSEAD